jgi:hypothetical protein
VLQEEQAEHSFCNDRFFIRSTEPIQFHRPFDFNPVPMPFNAFVVGFHLLPLKTPARMDCFVYLQYDHDELEVSNEVIYWQSSQGGQVVEGGLGEGMQ